MDKQLFDELVDSIKEAGKIHRGEIQPSREFVVVREEPDDAENADCHPANSQ